MTEKDGVIKFDLKLKKSAHLPKDVVDEIQGWRKLLYLIGLIGQDEKRYGGAGYGNVSQRIKYPSTEGVPEFVITGSQTGGLPDLEDRHYVLIRGCDAANNLVVAEGLIAPSAETFTHETIYLLDGSANWVMHVHSPDIWKNRTELGLLCTIEGASYGTQELAGDVRRLFAEEKLKEKRIFAIGGHEDGIISFGPTGSDAGEVLIGTLVRAFQLVKMAKGSRK